MIDLIISGLVTVAIDLLFVLALIALIAVGLALAGIGKLGRNWIRRPRMRRELARITLEHHRARREIEAIADRAQRQIRDIGAGGQVEAPSSQVERW